ncbi:junctional adhesion molecule B-like [Hemitrygon akajei]|uniref:junctional adhesion molecule B-like n=1 Tax=Hemitrygon akajei TaxID=2704970 RepID=UPI003BF994E2
MGRVGAFFLSLSFLELIHRTSGVQILSSNHDIEVNEHGVATLKCSYVLEKQAQPRLEWKMIKGQQISFVYFNGSFTDKYEERARLTNYGIELHRVTREDTATYRCEVTASQDRKVLAEVSIRLIVLVRPAVPTCKVPSSALSGSTVKLLCEESEASPPSMYTWYKDDRVLPETPAKNSKDSNTSYTLNSKTGVLVFNPVKKSNSGSYSCNAYNKVGRSERCSVKFMQINDLDVSAIVIAVVIVAFVLLLCGLGLCYVRRKGYLGKRRSTTSSAASRANAPPPPEDFKHTKSFVI